MKNKKAFTLIELIAVLVILAILALIVTPLVLNIVRKARASADKRSIDAYGRSVELAIADYLLDKGEFPTSIEQLTIEYNGDKVECSTTQLNEDTSVYLAECTVGGRSVEGYTYGKDNTPTYKAYSVGDYYVLKDSEAKNSKVTLLKAEPLTVAEVNQYGTGHVNMYLCDESDTSCHQTAYDNNGYGGMAYYSSSTCGNGTYTGCTTDYAQSDIKYVVDAWKADKAPSAIEARLITIDELMENAEKKQICTGGCYEAIVPQYDWLYNSNYWYWTMSQYEDSASSVWHVSSGGGLDYGSVHSDNGAVRPVITLLKSELN